MVHPTAKRWTSLAASERGVIAVGDAADAVKHDKYDELASGLACEFVPFVLFTYGGFHDSARRFINRLCASLDPVTSLVSADEWRMAVQRQIAMSVQRGNADIMIHAGQHARDAVFHRRRLRVRASHFLPSFSSPLPWPVRSPASSSGAAPSCVHTVTLSASVPPPAVSAVQASPSAGGGVEVMTERSALTGPAAA
ncbi:MAG: hypothetical protein ACRETA_14080 [Gammaproteobacteria bacterium]